MLRVVFVVCLAASASLGTPIAPRILGGQDADISDFPFMVSIEEAFNGHSCGGAILSADWLITDGWCAIPNVELDVWAVRVGTAQLGAGGSVHSVADWVFHPQIDVGNGDFDFALLRVDPPFELNATLGVGVVALPAQGAATPDAGWAQVAGWGQVVEDGDWTVGQLQYANLTALSDGACAEILGAEYTERKLCAQDAAGLVAMCFRDEGGPLVVDNTLYGVALYPGVCGDDQLVQLFSRVADQRDWIRSVTGV